MSKEFDCVEMKNEIQRKIEAEFNGLSNEERTAKIKKQISEDKKMSDFLAKVRKSKGLMTT